MVSISSIKIIQGASFRAFSNNYLTLEAPTPTYISTNSEALQYKNSDFDSFEVALASIVFPVPGGP